jgi:hypothetical protein
LPKEEERVKLQKMKELEKRVEQLERQVQELMQIMGTKEQKNLFPEPLKTTFRNSSANSNFTMHFAKEAEAGIDIENYRNRTLEWSDKLPERTKTQRDKAWRTADGWLSTVKTMMRTDKKAGKLKMVGQDQTILSSEEKAYLLEMM